MMISSESVIMFMLLCCVVKWSSCICMSPGRRRPEKRCSMTRALVVMIDGIVCKAWFESCMMVSSNVTSVVCVVLM